MAHLLAIPFPAHGHLNPLLELCNKLASSSGFFITFLVTVSRSEFITNQPELPNFRFVYLPDECILASFKHSTSPVHFVTNFEKNLRLAMPGIIRDHFESSNGSFPRLTCVLTDVAVYGTEEICTELGICKASLSTFSASWNSINFGVHLLKENGLLPVRGSERLIDFIPGMPPIRGSDITCFLQEEDPADPGFKHRFEKNAVIKKNSWVLLNSFPELETSQLDQLAKDDPQFIPVGPLLPSWVFAGEDEDEQVPCHRIGLWREDLSCLKWLDKQRSKSVIYVSFGSLAIIPPEQITEIFTGLKRSGKKILWVMRSDDAASCVLHKEADDDCLKVVSWSPQLQVLKHQSVAAFLTHCGWNSMLEAIATRLPVICFPLLYEQRLNCALAAEHWKIGLRLPQPCSSADAKTSVELVTGDAGRGFRENISRLSAAARYSTLNPGGTSLKNLERFIEDMKHRAASELNV